MTVKETRIRRLAQRHHWAKATSPVRRAARRPDAPRSAQGFLAEGLQRTSAGLGSVIIDSQPLTVAALAALLLGERLRPAGVAGLALGVAGLCLLEAPPEAVLSLPAAASGGGPARPAAGAGPSLPFVPGAPESERPECGGAAARLHPGTTRRRRTRAHRAARALRQTLGCCGDASRPAGLAGIAGVGVPSLLAKNASCASPGVTRP